MLEALQPHLLAAPSSELFRVLLLEPLISMRGSTGLGPAGLSLIVLIDGLEEAQGRQTDSRWGEAGLKLGSHEGVRTKQGHEPGRKRASDAAGELSSFRGAE
jgi:hypothetical protein